MPRERELKLEPDAAALQRVQEWLHGHGAKAHPARITETRYFDSPDYRLQKSGISLRIRREGERFIQTVKSSESKTAGLFDRAEWESAVPAFFPDIAAAASTRLKLFRDPEFCRSLEPLFTVEARRTTFDLTGRDGIAVVIDSGRVIAGEHHKDFCEIEIEDHGANLDELFRTARQLVRAAPLQLGAQTKSGRGYKLLQQSEGVVHAGKAGLSRDISAQDAFRIIGRECLHQFAANLPATMQGVPEGLHQMRVGLRRLRACISLFSGMIECRETDRIVQGLKWMGQQLGHARDIDVLLEGGVPPGLIPGLVAAQQRARESMGGALRSPRFCRLMLDTLTWIECGSWMKQSGKTATAQRKQRVLKHASRELGRRYGKLVRSAKHLAEMDEENRHRIRIRAKKLRYGVEFFSGLFKADKKSRRSHALLSALKDLQNSLGALNDLSVRGELLLRYAGKNARPGIRAMLAQEVQRRDRIVRRATSAAEKISGTRPFWR